MIHDALICSVISPIVFSSAFLLDLFLKEVVQSKIPNITRINRLLLFYCVFGIL